MDTLKYPLNFSRGRAITIPERTDEYSSQAIAILIRTTVGEFPLEPTFGVSDPSFSTFMKSEFLRNMNTFWPEVRVVNAEIDDRASGSGVSRLKITFEG